MAGFGCGAGEQDKSGSLAGGVVIDLQGLPEPDNTSGGVTGLAEFVAVHAQHEGEWQG